MFKNILLAVDGSKASQHALDWVVRNHVDQPELKVTVLYVHEPFVTPTPANYVPSEYDYKEFERMPKPTPAEQAWQHFPNRVNVTQKTVIGNPAASILEEAQAGDYDVIVLGSRGHGLVTSVLLGSVSAKVLHNAPCAVLVVR